MSQLISPLHDQSSPALTLDFSSLKFTAAQFEQLCHDNPDLRLELTSTGELIVMPPAGSKTGHREFLLTVQLARWIEKDGTGIGFGPSSGFTLPIGSVRSPDASWLRLDRWLVLAKDEQERFAPVCPDFVVEIRSQSDELRFLQNKMREYLENGAQLAWLIDPMKHRVYVYRPGHEIEVLEDPDEVSGGPLMPGFALKVRELW